MANLYNLIRDKNYWTAISFLLNNEENKNKRVLYFKIICKSDLNAAVIVADSFFDDIDCNQLIDIARKQVLAFIDTKKINDLSKTKQYSFYISFLMFDLIEEAKFIFKKISNIKQENIFPSYLFTKYFSYRWISKHIILMIQLNMWKELLENIRFLSQTDKDYLIDEKRSEINFEFRKIFNYIDVANILDAFLFLDSFNLINEYYDDFCNLIKSCKIDINVLILLMPNLFFKKATYYTKNFKLIFRLKDYLNLNDWGINDKKIKYIAKNNKYKFLRPKKVEEMFEINCKKLIKSLKNEKILDESFFISKYYDIDKKFILRIKNDVLKDNIDSIFDLYYKIIYDDKFYKKIYRKSLKHKNGYWNVVIDYSKIMMEYLNEV